MSKNQAINEETNGRRPSYVKPAVEWEEPFEPVTSAISCAKLPGQSPSCMAAPGT